MLKRAKIPAVIAKLIYGLTYFEIFSRSAYAISSPKTGPIFASAAA